MSDQSPKVRTCLWFAMDPADGEAAIRSYTELIPDSRVVSLEHLTGPGGARTLVADFVLGGTAYRAIGSPASFTLNEATSLSVSCADQAEVDRYWDALVADGGAESQCGWLRDRWGTSWQIVPDRLGALLGDPDPQRAQRAMQAMLGMRRLVISELETAADGATS